MSRRTHGLDDALAAYIEAAWSREPELLARLRAETATLGDDARMQIAPEQGQLMAFLAELIGARRALEIGTFTGYSALAVARALPADGRLVACDVSAEWTAIARKYWAEAGVDEKIELRLAPAVETLQKLIEAGEGGSFDLAFIDADKTSYDRYYEFSLELLRPGGLILIDNVYKGRLAADPERGNAAARAIDTLNRKLRNDKRISLSLVPIADGLTLVRKRA